MNKAVNVVCKVLFTLILLMPVLGTLGVFPAPTADMYGNPQAWATISALMQTGYTMWIMAIVNLVAVVCLWTKREAVAALLILPIMVNIVAFHLFLDHGLLAPDAVPADILLALNLYFLWQNREAYKKCLSAS